METQKQMLGHITAWEVSGLTMKQYALQHKINYKIFNSWYNKIKLSNTLPSGSDKIPPQVLPSFIEIPHNTPSEEVNSRTVQIELELPGGIRIKIY